MRAIYTKTVSQPLDTKPVSRSQFNDTIYMSHLNTTHKRLQIRIPSEVHAALLAAREESDRSLNGEIVNRLRASLEKKSAPQPGATRAETELERTP